MSPENETKPVVSQNVLYGLAMVGGLGLTLMIVAAGIGVILPEAETIMLGWIEFDSSMVGLFVALGFGLLVASVVGWGIATRPFENFDDITVAQYHGHHHEEAHEEAHEEGHQEATSH